jgi:hypothetical protein
MAYAGQPSLLATLALSVRSAPAALVAHSGTKPREESKVSMPAIAPPEPLCLPGADCL